jgi:hypothetical protein
VAIISPKNSGAITAQNFFRGQGNESRGLDFGFARTALEHHCLPLNTDKFYVLKHKRMRLNPDDMSNNIQWSQERGSSYKNIDWYVPLKRQLRYDDPDANFPTDGPVYLVQWCDTWTAIAGAPATTNAMSRQERHVMYFRPTRH